MTLAMANVLCFIIFYSILHTSKATLERYLRKYASSNNQELTSVNKRSTLACAAACGITQGCQGFNFTPSPNRGICVMLEKLEFDRAGQNVIYAEEIEEIGMFAGDHEADSGELDPIPFVSVDPTSRFDPIRFTFKIPKTGIYMHSLTASGNQFDLMTNGLPQTSINRNTNIAGQVTLNSRDYMDSYSAGDILYIKAGSSCVSCKVAWTLFRVDDVMTHPKVAFSVGRTENFSATVSPLEFDKVLLDFGDGWNSSSHTYTFPVSGTYVIYFSIGCREWMRIGAYLMKNDIIIAKTYCYNQDHGTPATTSEGWLQHFDAGDSLYVQPMDAYISGFSDRSLQTSLCGFLYNPRWLQTVAWSVGRTTSWNGLLSLEDISPLPFDHVWVNEGGAWNADKATCQQTGLYVVRWNSRMFNRDSLLIRLVKNGVAEHELKMEGPDKLYCTSSRTVVVRCRAGDQLWLEAAVGTRLFSNVDWKQTSFIGFLIYQTDLT